SGRSRGSNRQRCIASRGVPIRPPFRVYLREPSGFLLHGVVLDGTARVRIEAAGQRPTVLRRYEPHLQMIPYHRLNRKPARTNAEPYPRNGVDDDLKPLANPGHMLLS